jgi:hypothetical protein
MVLHPKKNLKKILKVIAQSLNGTSLKIKKKSSKL